MTNQWGYVDPAERAHQLRAQRASYESLPYVQPPVCPLQPVQSPLAGLEYAEQQIMQAAGYPRYRNVGADMARGAVLGGLLGMLFGRRMARRAQRVQELKESLGIADVE